MSWTLMRSRHGAKIVAAPLVAFALIVTGLGLASGTAIAETKAKISDDELKAIAVKTVPGKAVDVAIEKKLGANRYVVEVLRTSDGAEIDVIIDMATHKVLGIDK